MERLAVARNIQSELEAAADKKGLSGDARKAYIGGAWQNITHGRERRTLFRSSSEHTYLSSVVGTVHDVRRPKSRPGKVVFRQGKKWYELPNAEFSRLVRAGKQIHREEEKEQKAIARYYKALEQEKAQEDRQQKRAARQAESEKRQQERMVREMERAEHSEVLSLIREAGGIRRYTRLSNGKEPEQGEYNTLPTHVRARVRRGAWDKRGLTMDEVAMKVGEHMPWLRLETGSDVVAYFDRHRETSNVRKLRRAPA